MGENEQETPIPGAATEPEIKAAEATAEPEAEVKAEEPVVEAAKEGDGDTGAPPASEPTTESSPTNPAA